ncbi:hypothetical protein [Pseudoxanthomonas mexicana]
MSGWSAGSLAGSFASSAQSYARNSACRAGVIQLRSLPSVGATVGVASRPASGVGYGVGEPSSPTYDVLAAVVASTARSCI